MIRQRLEIMTGRLSDSLFKKIMTETTTDILYNRVAFKQRTSFDSMINRAVVVHDIFIKSMDRCPRCDTKPPLIVYMHDSDSFGTVNHCCFCGNDLRSLMEVI